MGDARHVAEHVARASYGHLLSLVAVRTRDIAAAEDALADAFRIALETWPSRGIPDRPEAWLLIVARRSFGHARSRASVRVAAADTLRLLHEEIGGRSSPTFPDERLKLLFTCAHPSIDAGIRTPLMLQTVLGLDAARIGGAFLVIPSAMAQRLVRAKAKIRDAGIRFEEPSIEDMPARLEAVLSAIYAAYGVGWDDGLGTGLTEEAIFLGRLVAQLQPDQPEAMGLLALMLHCEARREARRGPDGAYVPLAMQPVALWSQDLIAEAEGLIRKAARYGQFGPFQTEAAIQSVHAQRAVTGKTNLRALVMLHDLLAEKAPSIGVMVSRAVVHGDAFGAEAGLALLNALDSVRIAAYQPYWAARAHVLTALDQPEEADLAFAHAIRLSNDPAVKVHLTARRRGDT